MAPVAQTKLDCRRRLLRAGLATAGPL